VLVFISYHTPDRDKAQAVEAALAARRPGSEWYLAPRNIVGGAYWVPGIADAITRADAVLFLAGRQIGPWQELEYYEALRLSREKTGRPRVVPIVTADQAPGLPFLAQLHQIFAPDPTAPESLAAIERALDDSIPPDASPTWQRFQPYKGLSALRETDAAFFFGRESETAEILDLLSRRPDRIIALIGQSGVGKSSLARAGVLARLKSQIWPHGAGIWPASLRDSRAFLALVVRPGEQPLKELALAFAQLYSSKSFELDEEAEGWARRFRAGTRLSDMLRLTRDRVAEALDAEPPKRFVLYLDQGEELYTRGNLNEASRFSALVAEAAKHEAFSVLMSLRSDYYSAYQNDHDVFHASDRVDVLPLAREVLTEVIRKPALTLGAHFESDEMAERVAEATEREPGALPLLSDLMHDIWLSMQARGDGVLRWSDNPEIVDVGAPLRKRAEAFLDSPRTDENTLRRLFTLRLAQVPEMGDPVRRRARKAECSAAEWGLAEKLADQDWRLLTLARAVDDEPVVEVAHEQLLRRWPRLKAWLDEEREFLVWKSQVEQAAAEHAAAPEGEKATALLMGRRLAVASGWFDRRADDLGPDVSEFVSASILAEAARRDAERRQRRRTKFAITSAVVIPVVVVILIILALFPIWHAFLDVRDSKDLWDDAKAYTEVAEIQRDRAQRSMTLASVADSVGDYNIGDLSTAQGDLDEALAAYSDALDYRKPMAKQYPSDLGRQRVLSTSQDQIGDVLLAQGRFEEALTAYRESLAIRKTLAQQDPANNQWQRDVSIADERIGDTLKALALKDSKEVTQQRMLDEALAAYRDALTIKEKLAKGREMISGTAWCQEQLVERRLVSGPSICDEQQRELSINEEQIGDVLVGQDHLDEALAAYRDALAIRKTLARNHPGNVLWETDLVVSLYKIACVGGETEANLSEALAILKRLDAAGTLPSDRKGWIPAIEWKLMKVGSR
jgi:tetratricopeptide (TPR) repeat protein